MPGKTEGHDVRYDYAGLFQDRPRLTCRTPGCREATLVAQPYMTQEMFNEKLRQYILAHPPRGGQIIDDDGRCKPILVSQLAGQS